MPDDLLEVEYYEQLLEQGYDEISAEIHVAEMRADGFFS